jgi:uncharacterized protein (TIGR01777 family)
MKLVVAGGSGFLGRPLADACADAGHAVVVLTRSLAPGETQHDAGTGLPGVTRAGWRPGALEGWAALCDGADAVVNLAGESIGAGRWTQASKARLRQSRLEATTSLVEAMRRARRVPQVFVSASAVGYYGARAGDRVLDEEAPPGDDFLAGLCVEWEHAAKRAAEFGVRVVLVRTGLVLDAGGGALARMIPAFRLGLGGRFGSGRQYVSWIHRHDWLELVRWAIAEPRVAGPINATAPTPVTNAEFARALGRALGRPAWLPAPAVVLRLALGEMAEALLLGGQRAVPARALALGFAFRFPDLDRALHDVVHA